MTTSIVRREAGGEALHRVRATLWWWAVSLRRLWSRRRARLDVASLNGHALRDIGIESWPNRFGTPRGWTVAEHARMAGPYFLGR
jgi:uncharacterized protein YjiS (DUF1127 family)